MSSQDFLASPSKAGSRADGSLCVCLRRGPETAEGHER